MDDTITVTTTNKRAVVIRNYTTHKDDRLAAKVLHEGVLGKAKAGEKGVDMEFSPQAIDDSTEIYIKRLVISIDGDKSNIDQQIDDLRSEDYADIERAIKPVIEGSSDPKGEKAQQEPTDEG